MADLGVEFCDLHFKNPIIVSSIEATNSLDRLKACIDNGAAGAIVKTLTDMPTMATLTKHSKYAILDETGEVIKGKVPRNFVFYSRSGFSSTLYEGWEKDLKAAQVYADRNNAHIIASVGASSLESWATISMMAEDCGVPIVELNLGCPHTSHMSGAKTGVRIGQVPELAAEVVARVAAAVKIPVLVKLTPEAANLTDVAASAKKAGAAAVTVNSRFTGFAVDIETGTPRIGGPAAVGGPWIKYVTLRWVHDIYSSLGLPIAGSNGIFDWRDAISFIMSGARIMQVGSVLMLKGYDWVRQMIQDIDAFLDEHGYGSVEEIYGMASRNAVSSYDEQVGMGGIHAVINDEKCTRCWNCVGCCFYNALSRGEDKVIQNIDNCIGCELCFNVCPFEAVSFASKK